MRTYTSKITLYLGLVWLVLLQPMSLLARPSDPSEALKTQDYAALVRLYQGEIDKSSEPTSTMYYNLGVAYMLMGRRAEAITHYEMALYLEPTHREARHNLEAIHEQAPQSVSGDYSPLVKFLDPLCYSLSIMQWALLALGCFSLAIVCFCTFRLAQHSRWKRLGFYGSLALFFLTLFCHGGILHQIYYRNALENKATVAEVTNAYLSASEDAELVATLPELVPVRYIEQSDSWAKVELMDQRQVWVKVANLSLPLMTTN